ncbi:MAG TPA: ATP-binding protein, partial [Sporichthyaceae bacterium]|nr:ATP-binding protein [Sporichthyaceae bacterium]
MAIRFVRVEQMFGLRGGLFDGEDADVWTAVGRAIDAEVPEAPDLDFKRVWWDKATEMAKDCAALANGLGGVIIVGVDDDHRDVAAAWSPVPLTRGLDLTLQQAVAANTAPKVPGILVRAVPDPADPARGVVIVGVPRSPVAPHAHPVNRERLGYPIRRSTSTDWLLEYEIADRYRSRFDLAHSQQDRADDVRRAALPALDRASWVWTTVALVPSATGSLP